MGDVDGVVCFDRRPLEDGKVSVLAIGSMSPEVLAEPVIGVIGVSGFKSLLAALRDVGNDMKPVSAVGDRGGVLGGDVSGEPAGEVRGGAVRLDRFS